MDYVPVTSTLYDVEIDVGYKESIQFLQLNQTELIRLLSFAEHCFHKDGDKLEPVIMRVSTGVLVKDDKSGRAAVSDGN